MSIKQKLNIPNDDNYDDKDVLFLLFKCYSSLPSIDQAKCKYLISELMKDEPKNVKYIKSGVETIIWEKDNSLQIGRFDFIKLGFLLESSGFKSFTKTKKIRYSKG